MKTPLQDWSLFQTFSGCPLNQINSFQANITFLYPMKTSEKAIFSGGIQMRHWHKTG